MKYTQLSAFSGINRQVSHLYIEAGEYAEAQNFSTPKIGVLKKTGDYQIKNAQITASQDILGGIDWIRADGTHTHLVACDGAANADIYESVTGTWTAASQSLTAAKKVRFAFSPTLDTLFAVNKSDATRSYNATSWSTSTDVTSAPKADLVVDFANRINLLNVDVSGTIYEDRMYRSALVDVGAGSLTWGADDWITFEDTIVGWGKAQENLFVACENTTQIWTKAEERYTVSFHGCVSHESICDYGRWTFWASRDGFYAFDGANDQKISLAIQEYWDAIPTANLSSIQAKVLGHHVWVYIGDVTVEGRSLANVMFDYDVLQNNWNRLSLADEAKHLHTYVTSTGKALFMGNDNGQVFQMFTSASQNTAKFSSFLETHWNYGSGVRTIDSFRELWGIGDKLSGLKVSYKVDDGEWQPAGQLNGTCDVVNFKAKGYRIKFLLEENSANNLYEIYRLDLGYLDLQDKSRGEK